MRFASRLPADLPEYVSCPQLADLLGVSTGTVRNWCRQGRLPQPVVVSDRIRLYSTRAVRRTLARLFPELLPVGGGEGPAPPIPAPLPPIPPPPDAGPAPVA